VRVPAAGKSRTRTMLSSIPSFSLIGSANILSASATIAAVSFQMQKFEVKRDEGVVRSAAHSDRRASAGGDIGHNLRMLRKQQGLSLDHLAQRSGVSRAMLGQIETGKSSPTVALLGKVANALGLPIAALISEAPVSRSRLLSKASAQLVASGSGHLTLRCFTSFGAGYGAGFYALTIAPGHRDVAAAQGAGMRGCLAVSAGHVEMTVGVEPAHCLGAGDALLFDGSLAQAYFNPGTVDAVAYLVRSLARNGYGLE
jgi:transcriptional regulator with XRE-family HTH domain